MQVDWFVPLLLSLGNQTVLISSYNRELSISTQIFIVFNFFIRITTYCDILICHYTPSTSCFHGPFNVNTNEIKTLVILPISFIYGDYVRSYGRRQMSHSKNKLTAHNVYLFQFPIKMMGCAISVGTKQFDLYLLNQIVFTAIFILYNV